MTRHTSKTLEAEALMKPGLNLILVAAAAMTALLSAGAAGAEPRKLAVLPIERGGGLTTEQVEVLYDAASEAAMGGGANDVVLVPKAKVSKALGKGRPVADEVGAARAGRKAGADLVLLATVREVDGGLRVTARAVEARDATITGMASAQADGPAGLEARLREVVAAAMGRAQAGEGIAGAHPGAAKTPPTASFIDVKIDAEGARKHRPEEGRSPVEAEVFINGRYVGKTPFADGLPPGRYLFEVKAHEQTAEREVTVVAGDNVDFAVSFDIPMTEEERAAEQERVATLARTQRAKDEAERQEIYAGWKRDSEAVNRKRRPMIGAGVPLLVLGLCLIPAGIVFEVSAVEEDEKYAAHKAAWLSAVDPWDIAEEEDAMNDAARVRDLNNGLGIASLVIGGASLITGIVLVALAPDRVEKPARLGLAASGRRVDLSFMPSAGADGGGVLLDLRF
jgi:hypothetical protein